MGTPRARLLALALVVAVAGCGDGGGGDVKVDTGSAIPDVTVLDRGLVSLTDTNQDQTFEVAVQDAVSLTIVADGGDATDIDIGLLRSPSGVLLVTPDSNDANPLTGTVSPQEIGGSVATAMVPSTPDAVLEDGTYTFSVASFDAAGTRTPATVRLRAIVKHRATPCGRLPLDVYFVGAPGLSAATAQASPGFRALLGEITRMFDGIGIRVELAELRDVVGDPALRLGVLDVLDSTTSRKVLDGNLNRQSDEMDEIFTLSGGGGGGVNLFLVDRFIAGPGHVAAAGGQPGPSILSGTVHSGVAASTLGGLDRQSDTDLQTLGREVAIEIARYLGAPATDDQEEFSLAQAAVLLRNPAIARSAPRSSSAPLEVLDLGSTELTPMVPSQEFHVCVEDAVSLSLIADGGNTSRLKFETIEFPDGPVLFSRFGVPPQLRLETRPRSAITTLIPNTPLIPLRAGTHRFSIEAEGSPIVRLTALINHRQDLSTGRLNLNVFFVAVPGLSAGSAGKNRTIRMMREAFDAALRKVGLRLGRVTFHDVPEDEAMDLTLIDLTRDSNGNEQADQLDTLFSIPRDTDPAALDIFLVQQFLDGGVIGMAGAIPGPSSVPPTQHSGVAVAVFDAAESVREAAVLATIAAHESGHYLGLYHTTEIIGLVADPLPDTPVCDASVIQDASTAGSCPDASNLMFPGLVDGIEQFDLTPDQGFVLQRSPLVTD